MNAFGFGGDKQRVRFRPRFPEKYRGDVDNIVPRSRPELILMRRFDENQNVLSWSSEETVIPYINKMDGTFHRYLVDFYVKIRKKDGSIEESIIEYKPEKQTRPPVQGKSKKTYINETKEWIRNQSKWDAARRYGEKYNMKFVILTEKNLGI